MTYSLGKEKWFYASWFKRSNNHIGELFGNIEYGKNIGSLRNIFYFFKCGVAIAMT